MSSTAPAQPRIDETTASSLAEHLLEVSELAPQRRGYAFEKFLKSKFDAYGLSARASFRLVGEQIDGSFVSGGDTYLLEAKWTIDQVDAATLCAFNAKVQDKASWSRGLLVSHSGFSSEGLNAFGRGNSVICMDGLDLHNILSRRLDFATVLAMKAQWTAETGQPFVRVDDLPRSTRSVSLGPSSTNNSTVRARSPVRCRQSRLTTSQTRPCPFTRRSKP